MDQPTPEGVRALRDVGLSVRSYALLNVVVDEVFQLVWFVVGTLLFLRRSDDRMALLVSLFLVTFGTITVAPTDANTLLSSQPAWWLPIRGVQIVGSVCSVLFFFPFQLPVDLYLLGGDTPLVLLLFKIGFTLSFLLIPLSVGVAVVSSRLFDIDVLINRTLVYGSLTAMLIGLYFSGIVVLQRLFVVLTGEKSTLAVVASTLLIAALFNPFRHRIQSFIDRRFYRRKYDAAKTLDTFFARLRDETDLLTLSEELISVVRETMQPEHVSLWVRPDTASEDHRQ